MQRTHNMAVHFSEFNLKTRKTRRLCALFLSQQQRHIQIVRKTYYNACKMWKATADWKSFCYEEIFICCVAARGAKSLLEKVIECLIVCPSKKQKKKNRSMTGTIHIHIMHVCNAKEKWERNKCGKWKVLNKWAKKCLLLLLLLLIYKSTERTAYRCIRFRRIDSNRNRKHVYHVNMECSRARQSIDRRSNGFVVRKFKKTIVSHTSVPGK